jgi:cell division protein FtsW
MTALRTNLFMVVLGLALLGATMVYSATAEDYGAVYLLTHLAHLTLGLGVFVLVSRMRYPMWRRLTPWVYGLSLLSLILVLIPGVGVVAGGARRWLDLGVFSLQPAEFAKLAAIIILSCAISRGVAVRGGAGLPEVAKPLLAVGVLFGLILLQPDFGTSVVLLAGAAGVLWASELRTRGLLLAGGLGGTALAAVMMAEPYRRERFFTYLNPWATPEGDGYQTVQAMTAIKSGGLLGSGPGAGELGHTVPEIGTDMIFALIGEELGLPGMLAVILGFSFIALAGLRIALRTPSVLGRCLAAGISTVLVVQATFNMGATLGLLPLSGMTLPFISSGGSSIIVSFAAVGILYRISEDSERARDVKPHEEGRGRSRRPAERPPRRAAGADSGRRYGGARDARTVRSG